MISVLVVCLVACGSAGNSPPPPPPCDAKCQDETAIRALREVIKLAYNITLQGKAVGDHDESSPCPLGGSVRVVGNATSNAVQGSTFVNLTYTFTNCSVLQKDATPEQNYKVTITGSISENGTLAVQPSSTSAATLKSDALSIEGTVYDPPSVYSADKCPVTLGQDGARISGTICGRDVSVLL
jgi:hypothetical protein